jgi:hypothetical protein
LIHRSGFEVMLGPGHVLPDLDSAMAAALSA